MVYIWHRIPHITEERLQITQPHMLWTKQSLNISYLLMFIIIVPTKINNYLWVNFFSKSNYFDLLLLFFSDQIFKIVWHNFIKIDCNLHCIGILKLPESRKRCGCRGRWDRLEDRGWRQAVCEGLHF